MLPIFDNEGNKQENMAAMFCGECLGFAIVKAPDGYYKMYMVELIDEVWTVKDSELIDCAWIDELCEQLNMTKEWLETKTKKPITGGGTVYLDGE